MTLSRAHLSRLALALPALGLLAACDPAMTGNPTTSAPKAATPVATPVKTVPGEGRIAVAGAMPDQLNTTSAAEKAAATDTKAAKGGKLGSTVASLGDATQGGFWLKTPLVKTKTKGRITDPATGKSANVDLIPLGGAASGGSQISLPAMQAIGASLTDLPKLDVFGA